jgi:hypothetical protein
MKTFVSLALLTAASDAAPQNLVGELLDNIFRWQDYFPKFIPIPDNIPAPVPQNFLQSAPVVPELKAATPLGILNDPQLNRDSCNSIMFGDRALWTCRDTQYFASDGSIRNDVFIST